MNEFVDPTEVERVAKLMHQSAIDWHKEHGRQEGMYVSRPWQEIPEVTRERYRYAARVILNDLCPAPTAIVTMRPST
jgi:hypothetical protein